MSNSDTPKYAHAECDAAIQDNRFEDACDACKGIEEGDPSPTVID